MSNWWDYNRRLLLQWSGALLAIFLLFLLLKEEGWDEILVAMKVITLSDLLLVAGLFAVTVLVPSNTAVRP
jgi:uncharacterized membrane protein YbhN (UPF0104 family)